MAILTKSFFKKKHILAKTVQKCFEKDYIFINLKICLSIVLKLWKPRDILNPENSCFHLTMVFVDSFLEITQLNGLSEDQEQQQQQGDQEEEGSYVQVGRHVSCQNVI